MSDLVVLSGFSLLPQGPTLSLSLSAGQSMCVIGPASGGKTRLLRAIQGKERAAQGQANLLDRWSEANRDGFWRRATPTSLARKWAARKAGEASHALSSVGLWPVRTHPLDDLSASQLVACELLRPLAGSEPILFIDGHLDTLDPWATTSVMNGLRQRLAAGGVLVVASNRLERCVDFDLIVVMSESQAIFAGTLDELLREADDTEMIVESRSQAGVRALVEPFEVAVSAQPDGIHLRAKEGQAIAAKLLTEGYGDVRAVVLRPATVEEAVRRLFRR